MYAYPLKLSQHGAQGGLSRTRAANLDARRPPARTPAACTCAGRPPERYRISMGRLLLLLLSHRGIAPQLAIAWVLFFLSAGVTYVAPPVSHASSPPCQAPKLASLGVSQAQVSLLPAVFLMTKGVCALPAGEALHRHGPHRCILWGTAALVLATAAYTQASRYWHFVVLHACFGVCDEPEP